jgi:Fur family ferric uptake transcriptional regulator
VVAAREKAWGPGPAREESGARGLSAGSRSDPLEQSVEEILGGLRARGARVTRARRLVVRALVAAGPHCSAEDVAAAVEELAPAVSRSTVYRNLAELERMGVVSHAHLGHGAATYHLAGERHGHLVCEVCGTSVEMPVGSFEELASRAVDAYGFEIDPRHFAVLGRCRACAARERSRAAGEPPSVAGA